MTNSGGEVAGMSAGGDEIPASTRRAAQRARSGGRRGRWKPRSCAILREADGPLTPGEVREQRAHGGPRSAKPGGPRGELSYSTVVTIVSRLHAKGLLARQRAGRGFTYTPVDDASLAASRMSQALGSEHDHDAVLSRFVSGLSSRDARLLRELLAGDTGPAGGGPGPAGERGSGTCGCCTCPW